MRRMTQITVLMLLAWALVACNGLAGEPEIVSTLPPRPTEAPIQVDNPEELGAAVFAARCASCHGVTGQGDGDVAMQAGIDVPDFTIEETSAGQTIDQWTNTIRYGRLDKLMPPWDEALSDQEIAAVADYTYTLWQNPIDEELALASAAGGGITPIDADERTGTISGQVIQGTAGEAPPQTLLLGLHILDNNSEQVAFVTQDLEGTDQFVFEDVIIRNDYNYLVTLIHGDAVFASANVAPQPDQTELQLPVTVYETTLEPDVIDINLLVLMLAQENDRLVVQQFMRFANTSDRVFRSENRIDTFAYESVVIPIPEDAVILNREALGSRFLIPTDGTEKRLIDTQPVIPGQDHIVEIIYSVPLAMQGGAYDLTIPLGYDVTSEMELYVTPGMHRITEGTFQLAGQQNFDFGTFDYYVAQPRSAGDDVQLRVASATASAAPGVQVDPWAVMFVGIGVVLAVIGAMAIYGRPYPMTQEQVLEIIVKLDQKYAAGEINQEEYERLRAQAKKKLSEIMQGDEPELTT